MGLTARDTICIDTDVDHDDDIQQSEDKKRIVTKTSEKIGIKTVGTSTVSLEAENVSISGTQFGISAAGTSHTLIKGGDITIESGNNKTSTWHYDNAATLNANKEDAARIVDETYLSDAVSLAGSTLDIDNPVLKIEATNSITVTGQRNGLVLTSNSAADLKSSGTLTIKGLGKNETVTTVKNGSVTTKKGNNQAVSNTENSQLNLDADTIVIDGSRFGLFAAGSSKTNIHSDSLATISATGASSTMTDGVETFDESYGLYTTNKSTVSFTGQDVNLAGREFAALMRNDSKVNIDIAGKLTAKGDTGAIRFAQSAISNFKTGSAEILSGLADNEGAGSNHAAFSFGSGSATNPLGTYDFTWENMGDAYINGGIQGVGAGHAFIRNHRNFVVEAADHTAVYFSGPQNSFQLISPTVTLKSSEVTLASQDGGHVIIGSEEEPVETLTVISKGAVSEGTIGDRRYAVNASCDGILDIYAKNATIESDGHALGASAGGVLNIKTTGSLILNGDVGGTTLQDGFQNRSPDIAGKQAQINIDGGSGRVVVNGTLTSYSYDEADVTDGDAQRNWGVAIKMAEGGTLQTKDIQHKGSQKESGTDLTLNGAAWVSEGNAEVRNVESDGALIETNGNTIKIDSLTNGAEGTIVTSDSLKAGQLQVKKNTGAGLEFVLGPNGTDQLTGNMDADRETLKSLISIDESDADYEIVAEEGTVVGDTTVTVNADSTVTFDEKVNTVTQGLQDIAKANFLAVRSQMNDLQKRMGDLRTMPAASGAWVRYFGGQNKYGSSTGLRNSYNTVQLGADARVNGNFVLGGTFAYTDDDGHLKNGTSDGKQYSFGVYGSWMGDDGHYIDVIAKRTRVSTDFNLVNLSGIRHEAGYHNWANSISVEASHRFSDIGLQGVFLEPQAEFSYGYLTSAKYRTSAGATVKQGAVKTAVGRLGVAAGYAFPEKAGSAYFRASVLHDFAGGTSTTMSYKQQSRTVKDDLSGTWGEFAAGLTYNLTDRWSAYGEVQTTCGSPITNPWQVSAGVRMSF